MHQSLNPDIIKPPSTTDVHQVVYLPESYDIHDYAASYRDDTSNISQMEFDFPDDLRSEYLESLQYDINNDTSTINDLIMTADDTVSKSTIQPHLKASNSSTNGNSGVLLVGMLDNESKIDDDHQPKMDQTSRTSNIFRNIDNCEEDKVLYNVSETEPSSEVDISSNNDVQQLPLGALKIADDSSGIEVFSSSISSVGNSSQGKRSNLNENTSDIWKYNQSSILTESTNEASEKTSKHYSEFKSVQLSNVSAIPPLSRTPQNDEASLTTISYFSPKKLPSLISNEFSSNLEGLKCEPSQYTSGNDLISS